MVASFAPSQLSFPHRSSARRLRPAAGGHRTPGHVAAYRQRHQPPLLDLTAGAAVRWQNSAVPRRRAHLALRAERAAAHSGSTSPGLVDPRAGVIRSAFSTSPRAPLCGGRTRRCLGGGHTSPCGRSVRRVPRPEPTVVNKRKGKALIVRPHTGGHFDQSGSCGPARRGHPVGALVASS